MNKNVLSAITSLFSAVFGQFNWNSPSWLIHFRHHAKRSPKTFWGVTALIFVVFITVGYGAYWYRNLPKPRYITAQINAPEITPNDETIIPQNLVLNFGINENEFTSQSVAPINTIGKPISQGIEITPKIEGQWFWSSDSQLVFTPTEDWPAGQKFSVHCAQNFFTPNAPLKSHDFTFSTHPFEAKITEFKFYQDPISSEIRNAVATLEFNFPVQIESLEKNTRLIFENLKNAKPDIHAQPIKFSYTYDHHKRVAYLHSDTIKIKNVARYLLLTLGKEVTSSTGSDHLHNELSKNILIPDSSHFLTVLSASASIIRNDKDRPEQVLSVETSLGVNENEFNQSVHFYLLPLDYPATSVEAAKPNYQWQNPGEVTDNILTLATPLSKQTIPTEHNYSALHNFKFAAQTPRYIYIKVDKGMKGFGGFSLNNNYSTVIPVPDLPKEISFLHRGSLLALSGEKKLSVLIRGVPAVRFDFARVLPTNINQLVTQSQGDFNNPYFINPTFNQQNISQIFTDIQQFDSSDLTKQHYTALDLSRYLSAEINAPGPQGLFLLQARGWDEINKTAMDVKASRLVLITDLGLLVKDNNDGSHDVFVQSITQGVPIADVTVTVLGKNGLPILSRVTDSQGQVNFPMLKDFVDDREPTVYLANMNNDVSFMPFANENRRLNFSKFDIGGIYTYNQELQSLSAYLFSDRGIYRPGDEVHVGMIVKQAFAQAQASGLPLQAVVMDARGVTIKDQKFTLNDSGYMSLDFTTNSSSPTGQYMVNLYLVKDNLQQNLLGSTTMRVSEFQPDRMRITSNILPQPTDGWSSPTGLKADVGLWNLYGSPASNRRITARILLTPEQINFEKYPNYIFADPLQDPKKPAKVFTETLSDIKTNDKGQAEFDLHMERFEKAT